jgi:hypothetical protein
VLWKLISTSRKCEQKDFRYSVYLTYRVIKARIDAKVIVGDGVIEELKTQKGKKSRGKH